MRLTQFLAWEAEIENCRLLVADDEDTVVGSFRNVLNVDGAQLTSEEFRLRLTKEDKLLRCAVLDGRISENDFDNDLDDWLKQYNLTTDSEKGLILIGFSGDERNKTERCFRWYLKGDCPQDAVRTIVELCQKTAGSVCGCADWPVNTSHPVSELSKIIHTLQNLFQPVGWDAEKLNELAKLPDPAMLAEIRNDHFAAGGASYLGSQSTCHSGSDVLQRVNALCDSLGQGIHAEIEDKIRAFADKVRVAREALEKHAVSPPEAIGLPLAELGTHLCDISSAGDALLRALREIRKREQEKAK